MKANTGITLQPTSGNLFRYDGPAGTVVFLVALPLCLGIALASGAPLFAGIIAGIVGGIVISIASGSQVSVSGPAAGLTVIVASAIQSLGSFQNFTATVVLAGGFQIIFSLLRAGSFGDYVPLSVIKGMLAAIGLVIILKQIPHALGRDADYEGDFTFLEKGASNTLTDILEAVMSFSPGALIITGISLVILLFWDQLAAAGPKFLTFIPAPLLVVGAGIGLNQMFHAFFPFLELTDKAHLVSLPVSSSISEFAQQFSFPNFAILANPNAIMIAATLAVVGSLESLLSLEAGDKLDPYKRISPPNRELFAQGTGNIVSGLIGGLPVTSVVVRTSANVYSGARTWISSFTHGILLLVSAMFIPALLNLTPLCALAAILFSVGYKLTKVDLYKAQYAAGYAQFIPFIVTVTAIVFTDLLKGVLIGMAFGLFFVIHSNHHKAFVLVKQDNWYLIRFTKDTTFVNKAELKTVLRSIPDGASLQIDATRAIYIDRDIFEVVADFEKSAAYKNIDIEYRNFASAR
ncbi:MAG: SulP family inorganic anion transporter [Acidobacteria bacterium]|nr:SulP family inorganic anion transporter [Acidobacteriota bacterium]